MIRNIQLEQLQMKLREVKNTMDVLYPLAERCKDELNKLTLQELAIRTAMRSKQGDKTVKAESDDEMNTKPTKPVKASKSLVNSKNSEFLRAETISDTQPSTSTQDQIDIDYKEFLTLDPNFVKYSSGEEEDDDEDHFDGHDDLSEGEVQDVLLSDCDEEDSDSD